MTFNIGIQHNSRLFHCIISTHGWYTIQNATREDDGRIRIGQIIFAGEVADLGLHYVEELDDLIEQLEEITSDDLYGRLAPILDKVIAAGK